MPGEPEQKVDAIIVGGGLAGIHLALAMVRSELRPLVVNKPDHHSSSRIAAGIINPITGRRFAKSWLYERLQPVFTDVYQYWENRWDTRFFYPCKILRSVPLNKLVNDLDVKLSDPEYKQYCRKMTDEELSSVGEMIDFRQPGYVMNGYQVDTETFLDESIKFLSENGMYQEGLVEGNADQINHNLFRFFGFQSDKLIWASGASIVDHASFSWVRMNPNKGEVLHLQSDWPVTRETVKQSTFFVPIGNHKIWLGTYDSWEVDDVTPSLEALEYLKSRAQLLKQPYNIVDHLVAVRPAVEDRRPVLGPHPLNRGLYLFNGFGSKGTSLIPYFAQMLVDHMKDGIHIHPEADLHRYWIP